MKDSPPELSRCSSVALAETIQNTKCSFACLLTVKQPLDEVFLNGLFRDDFPEGKHLIKPNTGKRPNEVGKRRIEAMMHVGVSVGCSMVLSGLPNMVENGPTKMAHEELHDKVHAHVEER